MLVRDSKKHQPEFDLAEAHSIHAATGNDKEIAGEEITSPQLHAAIWPRTKPAV
jgi:hypothetical protein